MLREGLHRRVYYMWTRPASEQNTRAPQALPWVSQTNKLQQTGGGQNTVARSAAQCRETCALYHPASSSAQSHVAPQKPAALASPRARRGTYQLSSPPALTTRVLSEENFMFVTWAEWPNMRRRGFSPVSGQGNLNSLTEPKSSLQP